MATKLSDVRRGVSMRNDIYGRRSSSSAAHTHNATHSDMLRQQLCLGLKVQILHSADRCSIIPPPARPPADTGFEN